MSLFNCSLKAIMSKELPVKTAALFFSILSMFALVSVGEAYTPAAAIDVEQLVAKAKALHLAESAQWLKMMHYQHSHFGHGLSSEYINPHFFLAVNGQTDSEAELLATVRRGLSDETLEPAGPSAPQMTVKCQYPLRWKWLMTQLEQPEPDFSNCADYQKFRSKMNAESVTFVFSGYYVNNPSSAYGHVFLRLNRRAGEVRGSELLDTGVGYAANADIASSTLYAVYSLMGLLPGSFSTLPYYYKVREYSNAESRDLWEYDLNLTPTEVERLVDGVWELGSTYFNYKYATANCAYQLLYLLEVAAPRLQLIEKMPWYEIPVDALKVVAGEPGLVGKIHFRPSTLRNLEARYDDLSDEEQRKFLNLRDQAEPDTAVKDLPVSSQAKILDAVLDDIDFRHFRELVEKSNPEVTARKQRVLLARAKLPSGGQIEVHVEDEDRPDRGHASSRTTLGFGTISDPSFTSSFIDAEFRFAMHEVTDPLQGYLPYATVEMGRFEGRWYTQLNRFDLQTFSLLSIGSLAPVTRLEKNLSWRLTLGLERVRDQRCDDCLAAATVMMAGGSLEPVKGVLLYALAGPRGEAGTSFANDQWIAALSSVAGVRFKPSQTWQLDAEGEWRRVFDLQTFDRLAATVKTRLDLGRPDRHPFSLQLQYTAEVSANDVMLRYIRYF